MAGVYYAFDGILKQVASISSLRAAAGIYVPNHAFRHRNTAAYTGTTDTQGDGLTWSRTFWRDWYYYTAGGAPGDPYGDYGGAKNPYGFLDGASIYLATASTSATQTISTDHKVLGKTIFTDYLEFSRYFTAHYDKAFTLALVARIPVAATIGTNLKAFLACYDSDGAFITAGTHGGFTEANPVELVFEDAGDSGTNDWQRLLGHTASVIPDNTASVILHLGVNSPDGSNTGYSFADCSLMLNVADGSTAEDAYDPFIDLSPVKMQIGSAMGWESLGATSRVMLDGRRYRTRTFRDDLKSRFSALFAKTSETAYQQLITAWSLSVRGLGHHVPDPVPVCIDFGLGQLPFFGYYMVSDTSFNGTFHPDWQLADTDEAFSVSIGFEEV